MISPIGPAASSSINYAGALSPDALLLYCKSRLRTIDDQVALQFQRQEVYRGATGANHKLQARLQDLARKDHHAIDGGAESPDRAAAAREWAEVDALFRDALARMPPGDERARLAAEHARFAATTRGADGEGDADGILGKEETVDMAKRIGELTSDMSKSAELDMIQLQSLMSQRQQAIQLCTNLVAGLGQIGQQIAGNVGK